MSQERRRYNPKTGKWPKFQPGQRVTYNGEDEIYCEEDCEGNFEQWNATVVRWDEDSSDEGDFLTCYFVRPDEDAEYNGELNEEGLLSCFAYCLTDLEDATAAPDCSKCGEPMDDTYCTTGAPRCANCDSPCPGCSDS